MSGPRMDLLGADLFARGRVAQWRLKWAVQGSWKQMQKTLSPPSQVSRVRMAQNVKKCRFLHGRFLHRLQVWVWSCNMFSEIAEGVNISLGPWWIKRCHFIKKKKKLFWRASQVALVVKNLPANTGDVRDLGSIPGWGRSPGGEHGNPLQYSCLENPRDRGVCRATVHRVVKSRTRLKQLSTHACKLYWIIFLMKKMPN